MSFALGIAAIADEPPTSPEVPSDDYLIRYPTSDAMGVRVGQFLTSLFQACEMFLAHRGGVEGGPPSDPTSSFIKP